MDKSDKNTTTIDKTLTITCTLFCLLYYSSLITLQVMLCITSQHEESLGRQASDHQQ